MELYVEQLFATQRIMNGSEHPSTSCLPLALTKGTTIPRHDVIHSTHSHTHGHHLTLLAREAVDTPPPDTNDRGTTTWRHIPPGMLRLERYAPVIIFQEKQGTHLGLSSFNELGAFSSICPYAWDYDRDRINFLRDAIIGAPANHVNDDSSSVGDDDECEPVTNAENMEAPNPDPPLIEEAARLIVRLTKASPLELGAVCDELRDPSGADEKYGAPRSMVLSLLTGFLSYADPDEQDEDKDENGNKPGPAEQQSPRRKPYLIRRKRTDL